MKGLIIKLTSMGDIIHTLPALTDADSKLSDITFDWVVEESFQEIPAWHARVATVIPVALRRWRKTLYSHTRQVQVEMRQTLKELRERPYDIIIDAQGLVKSALVARLARGRRCGLDRTSAKELFASLIYQEKYFVDPNEHAVTRARKLFAQALGYEVPETFPDYGIHPVTPLPPTSFAPRSLLFLLNTTWGTKSWPLPHWRQLIALATAGGFDVVIPCGNVEETQRAQGLAHDNPKVKILSGLDLTAIAQYLRQVDGVVAVDTGLGHLSAALSVPTLSLYGATDARLTGTVGRRQRHLSAQYPCAPCLRYACKFKRVEPMPPCLGAMTPSQVWETLKDVLRDSTTI